MYGGSGISTLEKAAQHRGYSQGSVSALLKGSVFANGLFGSTKTTLYSHGAELSDLSDF